MSTLLPSGFRAMSIDSVYNVRRIERGLGFVAQRLPERTAVRPD